jgi:hypothetical protein
MTMILAMSGATQATWETFVIRGANSGGTQPIITENPVGYSGWTAFGVTDTSGGQKAGWGTNSMNGMTVGDIQSLSITRHSTASGYAPYFNIWITDGNGEYAVLANEPSNTGEWGSGTAYDTTWDILKDATAKVYETSAAGDAIFVGSKFSDFANYTILAPTSAPSGSGTGAPDDLNASTYTAYGFNWVFGDTQSNYVGGHLAQNPTLVPEPATMALLALGGLLIRRKK